MAGESYLDNKGFFCKGKYDKFRAFWCEDSVCSEYIISGYKIETKPSPFEYKLIGTDTIEFSIGGFFNKTRLNRKTLMMGKYFQCEVTSTKMDVMKPLEEIIDEAKNNNKI